MSSSVNNGKDVNNQKVIEMKASTESHDLRNENVETKDKKSSEMLYGLDDNPGWILSPILGFQHCLLAVGGLIGIPIVFSRFLCMQNDDVGYIGKAKVINSMFFVAGIATFVQTTFGIRLPIMQGASAAFVSAIIAVLSLPHNQCPSALNGTVTEEGYSLYNDTDGTVVDGTELWQRRMREVQGALLVSSSLEMIVAATGISGYLLKFIGPLVVAPSITLIGLSLVTVAGRYASGHWGIAAATMILLALLSQYFKEVQMPFLVYNRRKGFHVKRTYFFKLFSVLVTVIVACILSWILTVTGALPDDPQAPGYRGRIDIKLVVLKHTPWFRVPYPGQWGMPMVTVAGVVATTISTFISMVESTGDYIACSKVVNEPRPPISAFNRGLTMEGLGSLLAALIGTTTATTSYTQNIAALGITRVASRRVLQAGGLLFFVMGMVGKLGALVVVIPDPVIGGLFCIMFGMIAAIGMSNLQYVDLNSPRNLFVVGFSIFTGLTIPKWVRANPGSIQTGVVELDQSFSVILESELIIGFILAFLIDNTLPGTLKERGLLVWMKNMDVDASPSEQEAMRLKISRLYGLPFKTNFCRFSRYIPIFPEYDEGNSGQISENEKEC